VHLRLLAKRYEVIRTIGSGGAGELHLVRDRRAGLTTCALKVLRPRVHDPGLADLFRGEFLLLSELRHESIVQVRDFGVLETGEPYFTMDFLPGENGRPFVKEDRLEQIEYVDLACRMLGALATVHACGVIHRDVKPENILMRRGDGRLSPVLVDFGLAVTAGAARAGEATGTLPYVAPEVVAGAAADPRSDLFSLGMVLFETATGGRPAERAEQLREPHKALSPDRLRRLFRQGARGAVPKRFEEVVVRLLDPVPARRYPSAGAALADLARIYGEQFGGGSAVIRKRSFAVEPPLSGRKGALDLLLQRAEALVEGSLIDPIAVVAGCAGSGVSRLLATVRNHVAAAGRLVALGSSPFDLAREVAAHPLLAGGARPPQTGEGPAASLFRCDAMLHAAPPEARAVLLLDDVHLLLPDGASALRAWIAALEELGGASKALLVLGGRTDAEGPGAEILRTAGRAVPADLRDLAALSTADISQALGVVLGAARVPAAFAQQVHRACGGNPRLFAEQLRLLVARGIVDLDGEEPVLRAEKLKKVALPASLLDASRARLGTLPAQVREALHRFALIDRPLSSEAARAVAGTPLAELVATGFLRTDRGKVGFPHELARRGADQFDGAQRRSALVATADLLAPHDPGAAALLLAEAGEAARAREVGLPAARALLEARHLEEARRVAATIGGEAPDLECGAILVRALYEAGRAAEAGAAGERLLESHAGADEDLILLVGVALREAMLLERASVVLGRIRPAATGAMAARVSNARASILLDQRRYEEALRETERAAAAAGSPFGLGGNIALAQAVVLKGMGRFPVARALEARIVNAAEGEVTDRARASALANLGVSHEIADRPVHSLRARRRSVRLARHLGRLALEANVLLGIATQLLRLGRPASALRRAVCARETHEATAHPELTALALLIEAQALVLTGRPIEARARILRAGRLPGGVPEVRARGVEVPAILAWLTGRQREAVDLCEGLLRDHRTGETVWTAVLLARITAQASDGEAAEEAWRRVIPRARAEGALSALAEVRVGLAECALARGAGRLAAQMLRPLDRASLRFRTPARARALVVRATCALRAGEPGSAARLAEEAVAVANRTQSLPLRAEVYAAVASLLEEADLQRFLRQPTAAASAALLEGARDIWVRYGNETMLRKVDLHLAELPRSAVAGAEGPEAEGLAKILHIVREMNREFDLDRLLGLILDRAIELTQAERGFVILLREGRKEMHLARNIDREAVSDPEHKVSSRAISQVLETGRIVASRDAEHDPQFEESLSVRQLKLRSLIAVPFRSRGRTIGALYLDNRFRAGNFTEREERLLELFADQAVAAIEKSEMIAELAAKTRALEEQSRQQRREMKRQGRDLGLARKELERQRKARGWGFDRMVSRSGAMQGVVREAKKVAASDLPVLIGGESGTGKEVLARAIHCASRRDTMPFVAINCAAFPEALLEAELFGHVRGSFTGADSDRQGLFEEASGGTIFLDEIGDMALPMQVRLLRAIELGEIRRLGDSEVRTVDLRVLSATNVDIEDLIRVGRFREDLYYRLMGVMIRIPPLRDRMDDIEPLARSFVEEAARNEGRPALSIANDAVAKLESYHWPGNVRELRNVVMRAAVTSSGDVIRPDDVLFDARAASAFAGFDDTQADRLLEAVAQQEIALSRRQQTALTRVLTRGKLSFAEYLQLFRVSKSTAARDLDDLCAHELLDKRGKTRSVLYVVGPKLREIANAIATK